LQNTLKYGYFIPISYIFAQYVTHEICRFSFSIPYGQSTQSVYRRCKLEPPEHSVIADRHTVEHVNLAFMQIIHKQVDGLFHRPFALHMPRCVVYRITDRPGLTYIDELFHCAQIDSMRAKIDGPEGLRGNFNIPPCSTSTARTQSPTARRQYVNKTNPGEATTLPWKNIA